MNNLSIRRSAAQAGFTLIELVIVIVIIGILAAVAVVNLGNTAQEARLAKQQGTLGALKGAWGVAYATHKVAPTCAQVVLQMLDPVCTTANPFTCGTLGTNGVTNAAGTALAEFSCASPLLSPAGITVAP